MKKSGLEVALIVIGIILVSATNGIFKEQAFSLTTYVHELISLCKEVVQPHKLVYINPISEIERPLFPILLKAFMSSLCIFFLSIGMALTSSILFMVFYFSVGKKLRKFIQGISFFLGALPDIFVIGILQLFVVWFFKKNRHLID